MYNKNQEIMEIIKIPKYLINHEVDDSIKTCNFEYMSQIALEQKVLPSFYKVFKEYLPSEINEFCLRNINKIEKKGMKHLQYLERLKKIFDENSIGFFIIKGTVISKLIFNNPVFRDFGDVDIIIDIKDINKADKIMKSIGFSNELGSDEIPDMKSLECYEIPYFMPLKDDLPLCIELKISTSSIKNSNLLDYLKKSLDCINLLEESYYTLNKNNTFILLCTNAYSNLEIEFAKARLREIFDIYLYLHLYKLDWNYISKVANKFKITHKIYAILNKLNYFYADLIKEDILELFALKKIDYEKEIGCNSYGWDKDWNTEFIDMMLSRENHISEMYFQESMKAYSYRNKNYCNKIYIKDNESIDKLTGIKNTINEIDYIYSFYTDEHNIYVDLEFKEYNKKNKMRIVLVLFDIDREYPRKTLEFYNISDDFESKCLTNNLIYKVVDSSDNNIIVSIDKKDFNVLKNNGKVLAYSFFCVRKYNNYVDYAIKDDLKTFDFENPKLIYLKGNLE